MKMEFMVCQIPNALEKVIFIPLKIFSNYMEAVAYIDGLKYTYADNMNQVRFTIIQMFDPKSVQQ